MVNIAYNRGRSHTRHGIAHHSQLQWLHSMARSSQTKCDHLQFYHSKAYQGKASALDLSPIRIILITFTEYQIINLMSLFHNEEFKSFI